MVSPTPLSGEGDGFTWTQTEVELTITIDVPPGTQQQEIMMLTTTCYLLDRLLEENLSELSKKTIEMCFTFAAIWGFGGALGWTVGGAHRPACYVRGSPGGSGPSGGRLGGD